MKHDEFKLSDEQIREQDRRQIFDWEKRPKEQLTPTVVADGRLSRYFESIVEWADRIAAEHEVPLQKVETIIHDWEWDCNFSSVAIRWTSTHGIFMRVFALGKHVEYTHFLKGDPPRETMAA